MSRPVVIIAQEGGAQRELIEIARCAHRPLVQAVAVLLVDLARRVDCGQEHMTDVRESEAKFLQSEFERIGAFERGE